MSYILTKNCRGIENGARINENIYLISEAMGLFLIPAAMRMKNAAV
jgi:hypothetical protein